MERVNITIGPLSFDHADYDPEGDVLRLLVGARSEIGQQVGEGEETPDGARRPLCTRHEPHRRSHRARRSPHPERDGHLAVTVPETAETTAQDLAPAHAAV
jgi:hypothetical protein